MELFTQVFVYVTLLASSDGMQWPSNCETGQYFEPSDLSCQSCPTNVSMVPSRDGFACRCNDLSVPSGISRCKACNATNVVSTDRYSCVPRRCQTASGRVVCRKCPFDYISVTQNFDGSPMKEVLCVKCARGYRAENNLCVRCESCVCAKNEIVLLERCIPKKFVTERPKYEENKLNPIVLLDIVKNEYLCTQNDLRACRKLADQCVRNFYATELAGPCRYWVQKKIMLPKNLPPLTIDATSADKNPGEFILSRGMDTLSIVLLVYTGDGGLRTLLDSSQQESPCFLPKTIFIGRDYSTDCKFNVTALDQYLNETYSPYLNLNGDLKPLPVMMRKTNEQYVQKDIWPNNKFRRYFLIDNYMLITANITSTVYLRTLLVRLKIERDKSKSGSLRLQVTVETQYDTMSLLSHAVTMTLKVEHEMPSAEVIRGLEIWGGVLGALLAAYAAVQWRGTVRRGGQHFSLIPILAGCVADAIYFAALFSALHALAAEAGTLGITLPLSKSEEYMIRAFVYSSVSLKALKVVWVNWNQCQNDIFFLNWAEYNPPLKLDSTIADKYNSWRAMMLAKEWSSIQTKRRASPGYTVTLTLVILQIMQPWQSSLPQSRGYKWIIATIAWWSAYLSVLLGRWLLDKVIGSPTQVLPKVCTGTGMSVIVFQEEYYAHCVHGRNSDVDARSLAGNLEACRLVCAQQLRTVYKQLSSPTLGGLGEVESRHALLSRFLAAFFERALDGLSWVASERTVLERLFDVELLAREAGNTSALLYDPDMNAPSCFSVTWWGEEWSLGTFDAMLFGCIFIATTNSLLSALITIIVWQILKCARSWSGDRNQREKTNIEIIH